MRPTITFDPPIPKRGKPLKICFVGGPLPHTLQIDWDPAGVPTSCVCPSPGGCVTITVPDTATSVVVHDPQGLAEDNASVVTA